LLEELVGQGGFSAVFRGRDQLLKRTVAIKHLKPDALTDAAARKLFAQEAAIMANIQHTNVLTIHDHDQANDCLILEFADGGSLEDRLAQLPPPEDYTPADNLQQRIAAALPAVNQALELSLEILEGVAALHEASVVHRDLKPNNIMFVNHVPKVSDLGLARPPEALRMLSSGANDGGTLLFMAPEQWSRPSGESLTPAADVWAAGVILYRLLTGWWHLAFEPILADPDQDLHTRMKVFELVRVANVARPTSRRPGLPPAIDDVLLRAFALDPKVRYRNAGEFLVALKTACSPDREIVRRAQDATIAGRFHEARALIETVMAHERVALDVARVHAEACLQLRDYDAALDTMRCAGFADWPDATTGSMIAHVLVLKNRVAEAIATYRRGVERFASDLALREKLALLLWSQGQRNDARREIEAVLATEPQRTTAIALQNRFAEPC
jgi:tRNA A-37 threonylcarbamoyl transferase component Bud32